MKKIGKFTYEFEKECYVLSSASLVGEKEKNGIFKNYFKKTVLDDKLGEKTFEKGERKMLEVSNRKAILNAGLKFDDIDLYLGGDLMNQIVTTNYVAEKMQIPFVGIYSACSTITASIAMASCLIETGAFKKILCSAISHFSSAERQYRFPLEFGNQRQCYSQWTVTACGSYLISDKKSSIRIKRISFGVVQDYGVVDIANMGAAMAVAAKQTLVNFFKDTKTKPEDYDLIATGDLGKLGSDILFDLMEKENFSVGKNYLDCGHAIYAFDEFSYQGGSGAGCSASIFSAYIIKKMEEGVFKNVLLVATGALMSTTTNQQGDSIPCVAHLVEFVKE